ncbi:hypothetical protein [Mucilaginibacter sp. SG564]|uniref:hypothetical protein n=1 Tax=Mucilaginibacter sp. SG564 TaxID=2587022 RepID=UPI0015545670|nr:hypothetical protein [Mucilaginibacter sp. SG564]NOW93779.1 hypothetical protein [Mucilaginibacter sp. SG564]
MIIYGMRASLRKTELIADNCRQILKLKEMPASVKLGYENLKTHAKMPVWTFSGLLLIALAIVGFSIADKQKAAKVSHMMTSLKKDDILEVKMKDDH